MVDGLPAVLRGAMAGGGAPEVDDAPGRRPEGSDDAECGVGGVGVGAAGSRLAMSVHALDSTRARLMAPTTSRGLRAAVFDYGADAGEGVRGATAAGRTLDQ